MLITFYIFICIHESFVVLFYLNRNITKVAHRVRFIAENSLSMWWWMAARDEDSNVERTHREQRLTSSIIENGIRKIGNIQRVK